MLDLLVPSNSATVATGSTDPSTANDSDSETLDVFLPVSIDVRPGGTPNAVNLGSNGSDRRGRADGPRLRRGHLVDAERDRDIDLVLPGVGVYGCDSVEAR